MPMSFRLPGQIKKNSGEFKPNPEKQFKSAVKTDTVPEKPAEPEDSIRFDNMDQVETAFKKGAINWPSTIFVGNFEYKFYKSHSKGIDKILKGKTQGFIIYSIPKEHAEKAKEQNMNHWMIFIFIPDGSSSIAPAGVGFTTAARGKALYGGIQENAQVVGDIVLLKIGLPSGVISLKGKVDTGAEISSLHVDSKPQMVGDSVRFENHNASGSIITAPLVTKQAVKSADGGVEYRPIIELDIEIQGKSISKAQFNLNDRSQMEHEVLIGQNILEKAGFIVDPNINGMQEQDEEIDLYALDDEGIEDVVNQLYEYMLEQKTLED